MLLHWRSAYSVMQVNPGGIHGHNRTCEALRDLKETGFGHEVAIRHAPIYFAVRFVHGRGMSGLSPLFVGTLIAALAGLYFAPWIASALLIAFFCAAAVALTEIFPPKCLYLGSSTAESHRFLAELKRSSDIRWASLLMGPPPPPGQDALLHALDTHDTWSLRSANGEGWRGTVQLYLNWGSLVVLRANESTEFVEEELAMIAARYDSRIPGSLRQFVIACESQVAAQQLLDRHPALRGRIQSEEETLQLLRELFLYPIRLRLRLAEPLPSELLSPPSTRAVGSK